MIPFGPFRPDVAAINAQVCTLAKNCVPIARGYGPLRSLVAATSALPTACVGAAVVLANDGAVSHYAGTANQIYKLNSVATWGAYGAGGYSVPAGDRWTFTTFGNDTLATNITDGLQMSSGSAFAPVGGAPRGRYLTTVRDFVFMGSIFGNEGRVQWSSLGNATGWVPGSGESDYQDARSGGPVRGVIGGEVGYLLQAQRVTRMVYVPGSETIFQFDEVEGARGIIAPHSLVQVGRTAWYQSQDGLYEFDTASGSSKPIGVGKWAEWFAKDVRRSSEFLTVGSADPVNKRILWVYVPTSSINNTPIRGLLYDWSLDDATIVDVSAEAGVQWLTQGVTLDTMDSFGTLETLPFSLDSAFWRGGAGILGTFTTDHKLSLFDGTNAAATWETADGQTDTRTHITGTRPQIDGTGVTVAVGMRERDGDTIAYGPQEALEDTGTVPAHASGNYARARVETTAGANWTAMKGLKTEAKRMGKR